jgi:SprB repeat
MNKHYQLLLLAGCLSCFSLQHSAACGYSWISDCSSQVHLRINATLDSFNIADCPSGYGFDGVSLGNIQSLSLANAKTITWESCQNNVSATRLWYRVYEQGFPVNNWQSLALPEYYQTIEGPYTTRYRQNPVDISLTNGLTVGKSYTLEVYLQADIDTIGDDFIPETSLFRNNNGANYNMHFTFGGATAPPLTLLGHTREPSCFGFSDGRISVSAYGNLTGIFYQWSNINLNFFQQYNLPAGQYGATVTNASGHVATTTINLQQPALLTTTFSNIQSVGCNNSPGTATITPGGGTSPYQFLWENGQQTATAQLAFSKTWQVTVTDAHQCTSGASVFIGSSGQVSQQIQANICTGETYFINNQTFTLDGVYQFTKPGSGGCDTLVQLTLQVLRPEIALASLPSNALLTCAQPTLNLCATPANQTGFQWWRNGVPLANTTCVEAVSAGNYAVEATTTGIDKTCKSTRIIVVGTQIMPPAVVITGQLTTVCNTTSASGWVVANTAANGATFSWVLNGNVVSTDDSCLVTVTDWLEPDHLPVLPQLTVTDANGCQNNTPTLQTTLINGPGAPNVTLSSTNASSTGTPDGSVMAVVAGGTPPYTFIWNNGATGSNLTGLLPGAYCVTVSDNTACNTEQCIVVEASVTTREHRPYTLQLWPNPVQKGNTITWTSPQIKAGMDATLEILDINGRVMYLESNVAVQVINRLKVPETLTSGLFMLRLTTGSQILVGKISVQ